MAKIGLIREVAIEDLVPYERNAKTHSQEQVEKIANSIKEFGFLNPCLIDKDNNLIAGHGRVEACRLMGWEKVPCISVKGLTETQKKAYILAD
ncbi:MAG: ParB/Srx family N-terminal domain-containing protein, partial [Clostridia bacterium]|nr:ParB/Srx family N-terminal domain-containing protein [Clostridia bacterium]